ncbi:hypothetical protein SDRG_16140 [Saprolegnia diclina VS20]|uniref:Uncharacterized protein n=1 Tax=Saprolegnia diclina (strain VS20) TaxID=1156394 RepID=T0R940_SAPDV|nr:hypothetical protein SDRG_16140 [Saprolegnia diclina VS20]EQC25992.1 hypothetical protein SDRG_16140 [Saprolegnia diclina VS20]|eukprot:XP_008620560.1 hypothetical protein SDRG_16140 [Saprolegnia diclina VS20]
MPAHPETSTAEESSEIESRVVSADDVKKERKTRYVYREADDIRLLQQVLGDQGLFVAGAKPAAQWRSIHQCLYDEGIDVSQHSLIQRLKTIYKTFLDRSSPIAVGDKDPVDEKTTLLMEYHELVREGATGKRKTRHVEIATQRNEVDRILSRDAALASAGSNEEGEEVHERSCPPNRKVDANSYLQEILRLHAMEQDEATATKKRRLALEQRQLDFQQTMLEQHRSFQELVEQQRTFQELILEQQKVMTQLLLRFVDKLT